MDERELDFMLWQLVELFGWDLAQIVQHNTAVFNAGADAVFSVVIEAVVFWRLREAENINFVVFIAGIVEHMNIGDFIDFFDEKIILKAKVISLFLCRFSAIPMQEATSWPSTVAKAAPATPSLGKPNKPKIMIGSKIILTSAPTP